MMADTWRVMEVELQPNGELDLFNPWPIVIPPGYGMETRLIIDPQTQRYEGWYRVVPAPGLWARVLRWWCQ